MSNIENTTENDKNDEVEVVKVEDEAPEAENEDLAPEEGIKEQAG